MRDQYELYIHFISQIWCGTYGRIIPPKMLEFANVICSCGYHNYNTRPHIGRAHSHMQTHTHTRTRNGEATFAQRQTLAKVNCEWKKSSLMHAAYTRAHSTEAQKHRSTEESMQSYELRVCKYHFPSPQVHKHIWHAHTWITSNLTERNKRTHRNGKWVAVKMGWVNI